MLSCFESSFKIKIRLNNKIRATKQKKTIRLTIIIYIINGFDILNINDVDIKSQKLNPISKNKLLAK